MTRNRIWGRGAARNFGESKQMSGVAQQIASKVDEIMADAQSRFGHGVWFMEEDGTGTGSGGSGGDGDQNGGQGGSGQNGGQGLLDREAEQGGQNGDGQNGGQGGSGGGSGTGGTDEDALVNRVVQALEGRFDSIADRRVNAILREVRQHGVQQGRDGSQDGGTGSGGNGGGGGGQSAAGGAGGPAAGDVREARLAYREYVGDSITFLGTEEREHAMTLAQGMLAGRLAAGDDPDTAGREVARTVATQIRALRKHYEDRTLAALRRTGQIPESPAGDGQPPRGGSKPGDTSGFQKGQATAQRLLADRLPQS